MTRRRVILLGATGSIGTTSLRVLSELGESHEIVGLSVGRRIDGLESLIQRWKPAAVAVSDREAAASLAKRLSKDGPRIHSGPSAAEELVRETPFDLALSGIAGAAGLGASIAVLEKGGILALANKESMVMAGPLLKSIADRTRAQILPVDSEHSAIFQCLQGEAPESIRKVILTASGGPFRAASPQELECVTPAQARRHPTWDMGEKITIDSATLMNKALEVVEARWLFDLKPEQISVVVHPQSIVHSMVEFRDGSILAQLGVPDMAVPIRYALSYPERSPTEESYFDLKRFQTLSFEAPDLERFPGLRLGMEAAGMGGTAGAVLNAANEVAVSQFLDGALGFTAIARKVESVLNRMTLIENPNLQQVLDADQWARREAME